MVFFMQTNVISSNLVRYRKKLCETPKHDRILMYTNWMLLGGAAGELAGKRKRGDGLAHQSVRHSLWEQGSLKAHNELLFGCLDGEVEALQQRKAVYDEARSLSDGNDSCWRYSGSDSGSEAELEVGSAPLALEGDVAEVVPGGEEGEQLENWLAREREGVG